MFSFDKVFKTLIFIIFDMKSEFFSLLYTKSSECITRNAFKGRNTFLIPDFFVIISWMTIFLPCVALDVTILYILITQGAWGPATALLLCYCVHSVGEIFINTTALDKHSFSCPEAVLFLINLFGYGPIIICLKILITNYAIWESLSFNSQEFPFAVFHVTNENFSTLKICCFIYVVFRCIPRTFILCVLLMNQQFSGNACEWFLLTGCVLINMVIFSQMIASFLPIRKTAAYYLTSGCVILNATIKYLAAMCAFCIKVQLFSMVFREVGYFAVLAHIIMSFVWLWPCWQMLQSQPHPLSKFQFGTYYVFFILIFSFIYIHPFEKQGLIYYYLFYLINLFGEMYLLYSWCNPNTLEITYYLCLKIFFFGLLSCFGMVNIFLRSAPPESNICTQPTEGDKVDAGKRKGLGNNKGISKIKIYLY